MKVMKLLGLFIACTTLPYTSALGQSGNASLEGTVTDPTGAVIPSARVTVTNVGTGVGRTINTTAAGLYVAPSLIPGTYKIDVWAQGFRPREITDIHLVVDQQARVDVQLEVGGATQQVTVTSENAPLLQTTEASVGFVVESQQVLNLPLNGRYFTQLLQLSPGAVQPFGVNNTYGAVERNGMPFFDVNGRDGAYTFFRIDGIENNERRFGGANVPISIDAIQEVKLQTANFSAEYGRSPAQVDAVVKSGSNQMHGSVFEFLRNDALDARTWTFTGPHNKNLLKRNQFGGTVGGALKKDKLFYFFAFDGTREHFTQPQTLTVPSNDMRNGIFPAGDIIFDPLTQQPFPNNAIPSSRWDAIASKVLATIPAPNLPGLPNINAPGFPLAPSQNFYYVPFRNQTINQPTLRVDYNRSQKNSFFGRYTYSSLYRVAQGPLATNVQGALNATEKASIGGQNLSGAWYHTFSPHMLNELRAGFSTDPQDYEKGDNTDYEAQLGLGPFLYSGYDPGFPHFIIGNITIGSGDYRPLKDGLNNYQASDTLTLVRGSHNLRIGADFRRTVTEGFGDNISEGRFTFIGVETRDRAFPTTGTTFCPGGISPTACSAGNPLADFLLGYPSNTAKGTANPDVHRYFGNWAGFINDTWNVSPRLTLSLGFRYEYQTRFHADPLSYVQGVIRNGEFTGMIAVANDSRGNLSPLAQPALLPLAPGAAVSCRSLGLPNNCLVSFKDAWQPRFGLAYRIGSKTVLRAAGGVFYGSFSAGTDTSACAGWPLTLDVATTSYSSPPSGTAPPPLSMSSPFSGANPAVPTVNCSDPNRKLPVTYQWNLAIERILDANTTLSVAYVGNTSRHLDNVSFLRNYNIPEPWGVVLGSGQVQTRAFPAFGTIAQWEDQDSSIYHALQARLERRLNHGLYLSIAYTYSKNLNYQTGLSDPRNAHLDRGPANGDLRHILTVSPIYQLPVGKGQPLVSNSPILDKIVGGWQVSGIIGYHTGLPFTPTLAGVDLLKLNGNNIQNRPDRMCNGALSHPNTNAWFDPSCFVVPTEPTTPGALLHEGNSGRNILRGPGAFAADLGISKRFRLTERTALDLRTEMFNAFNHPILGLPNTALSASATATTQTRITSVVGGTFPRIIQLAMKIRF